MRPILALLAACSTPIVPGDKDPVHHTGETESPPGDSTPPEETGDSSETGDSGESGEPGPDCEIGVSGDLHVDEGETVSLSFTCGGVVRTDLSLDLDELPGEAVFDESTWTLTWETDLDDAEKYDLDPKASNGAELEVTLWVSDAFWEDDNDPVIPETYKTEDGLPVFHLTVSDDINNSYDTPATLVYRGHTYAIEAQYRGASSYYYPQKSFTLDFSEEDKFDDDDYGWGKAESLVLLTTFDDNFYLRNRLTYWLWGELDDDNMTLRTFQAVVYLDGEYWGMYEVLERVDEEFFEDRGLSHYGNAYKGIDHNANFYSTDVYGRPKSYYYSGYEKMMGDPEAGESGAYDDLIDLYEWAITSSDTEFRNELDEVMVQDEIFDWFILVTFAGGWDSGGKNQQIYHDPDSDGPWRFVPWDFNASWGQQWETSRVDATTWSEFTWANNLFYRSLNDDLLSHALWTRYRAALAGPLDPDVLLTQARGWNEEISPAAQRSWRKWGSQYHSYSGWAGTRSSYGDWTTPEEEAEYVFEWIEERWEAVDEVVSGMGY